jgi:OOP family OmpA-OmpF porin
VVIITIPVALILDLPRSLTDDNDGSEQTSGSLTGNGSDTFQAVGDSSGTADSAADDGAGTVTTTGSVDTSIRPPLAEELQADAADGEADLTLRLVDPLALSRAASDVDLRLSTATDEVCFSVSTVGIRAPYPAAIREGVSGQAGPVVVDLGDLPAEELGCVSADSSALDQIIADPIRYYLSFDDPNLGSSLRSQLATNTIVERNLMLDPDGGGATVVVTESAVTLTGAVPSFETEQWFIGLFSGAVLPELELINELRIAPETPNPSGRIFLQDSVLFGLGSAELSDPPPAAVRQLAAILTSQPTWAATIVGHTDNSGSEETNVALSLQRAEAVRDALVAAGVHETTLSVDGAGSGRPVADNSTPEGRAENRRIELEIVPAM